MKKTLTKTTTTASAPTHCAKCGAPFPIHPAGYSGAAGYAVKADGSRICYPCANAEQVEELKDRSRPCMAYVGKGEITTWTGGRLMRITNSRPCQLTRPSNWHDARSEGRVCPDASRLRGLH